MSKTYRAVLGSMILTTIAFPAIGATQVTVAGTVAISSAYVWRGVTNTNRPVLQPDLTVAVPVHGASLSAGAWASIEPARYDGASDISAVYGLLPGPAFTQYSAWIDYAWSTSRADLSIGATAYTYPSVAGLADDFNTVEVYASATLTAPLSPTVTLSYDVAAVRGAYVEGTLEHDVAVAGRGLTVGAAWGVSMGQGPDDTHQSYFTREGLTHAELSLETSLALGGISVAPSFHVVRGFDPMARLTAPDTSRSTKFWLGVTLSWTSSRGEEE